MSKRRRPRATGSSGTPARPAALVDEPSRRVQAARGLWGKGQRLEALSLFNEAIRQEPNNVRAYVMAARAYAEKYDFGNMEDVFEKLVRRAPRHPGVHHYIGESFALMKLPDRAVAAYQRAANLPGAGPPTWMELAALYERAHRLDEAEELIERTVLADYNFPLVSLVRGRIQRRQKRLDEAEATFRKLIERIPADSELACQAWGELALMKDEAGDWEGAIDAIERCKKVQRAHERPFLSHAAAARERMQELRETVTRDEVRRWRDEGAALAPRRTALLTGFPRSGTTLLEQMLDAHPGLVSSEERDFIGTELYLSVAGQRGKTPLVELLDNLRPEQIESERQRYFTAMEYLLGETIGDRVHLDKNPAYNLTIPLVLRYFPETRFIIALRDPRDVVLSCYLRYLPLNAVSVQFLDVKRTAERYAFDMTAWLKFRDLLETPWRQIRYEDTVRDPQSQARAALETLDLPWNDAVLNYRERLQGKKQVTSPTYEAVALPIYTKAIGRWRHYERVLEPAFERLGPFLKEFGYE